MKRLITLASSVIILIFLGAAIAPAQNRMNDKDVETMMSNLKSDAGRFRSAFDNSIKSSTIRHTSKEKDAKNLVKRFQDQTQGMLNHFKSNKQAGPDITLVIGTSDQIDQIMRETTFDDRTTSAWSKVRVELGQLADAFSVPGPSSQPH